MPNKSAEEADILRCGYTFGYFEKVDIIAWADSQIATRDVPRDELLDLSMCRDSHPVDVIKWLRALGSGKSSISSEVMIGFIGIVFKSQGLDLRLAIQSLFSMLHEENDLSDSEIGMIYTLDDSYDLALQGSYGTLADTEREFVEFVAPYAKKVTLKYPELVSKRTFPLKD